MPLLAGKAVGISRPIMGVVARRRGFWESRPLVYVACSPREAAAIASLRPKHWAAALVADNLQFPPHSSIPCIYEVPESELAHLAEGDIVCLDPTGDIALLYKAGNPHNSLLATNRCNCLCVMCPQRPGEDPPGLMDNNLKLLELMDPQRTPALGITGGEPTLLGEDLIRLLTACRRKLPKAMLTLLTNGRRFKDLEFARQVVKAGYPQLFMEIPLFADNDTQHDAVMGAKGSFYDTLEGLHNLALLGQPVGLRTVLHTLTVGRLVPYAEFIYRNLPFVLQVAFMGMETVGLARDNLEKLWIDPYEYRWELAAAVRYLARRLVPVSIYNHQLCLLPEEVWPFARQSITTWKQMYLPVCDGCKVRERCGGLFGTGERYSAFVKPVT